MKLNKSQWSKIIGAALVFIISLMAVFGYDVALERAREHAPRPAAVLRV
jgi:hypothetical protein